MSNQSYDVEYRWHGYAESRKNKSSALVVWMNVSGWMGKTSLGYNFVFYKVNGVYMHPDSWEATLLIMGIFKGQE